MIRYSIRIFLSIIFLSAIACFSQGSFRNGFIITNDLDTVYSEIEYSEWKRNFRFCTTRDKSGLNNYEPGQIKGYGFAGGRYFESQIVENHFAEVLVKGELSLYRVNEDFYIHKQGSDLYKIDPGLKKNEAGMRVEQNTRWRGVLSVLISDCENMNQDVSRIKPVERDLVKLVVNYNSCRDGNFTEFRSESPWIEKSLGFTAGMQQSQIKTHVTRSNRRHLADKYYSTDPSVGMIFILSFPRQNNRLALQAEAHLSRSSYTGYVQFSQDFITEYHNTSINLTTFSVPMGLRYSVLNGKYPLHLNLGVNYIRQIRPVSLVNSEMYRGPYVTYAEDEALHINKNEIGLTGGITIQRRFRNFNAGIHFGHQRNMLNNSVSLATNLNRFYTGIIITK